MKVGDKRTRELRVRSEKRDLTQRARSWKTAITEKSHDSDWWAISDCVGHVCFDCRGAEDWPERGGEEAGGLREYFSGGGVDLPVERESGASARSLGGDEDYGGATAGIGERSEACTRL